MALQSEVKRQYVLVAVAAVLLLLIVGYVAVTYMGSSSEAPSKLAPIKAVGKGAKSEETPQYQAALADWNHKHAADAQQSGKSYLSALSTTPEPVKAPAPVQAPATVTAPTAPAAPAQQVVVPPPVAPAAMPSTANGLPTYGVGARQLGKDEVAAVRAILSSWSDSAIVPANTVQAERFAASLSTQSASGNAAANAADAAAAAALAVKIVPDYARTYAVLETSLDTDENSIVTAYVPAGPFEGMRLFASGYKRLNNTVDLTFDAMVWQGHSYRVQAKPIDMDSQRSNLSGDVRHHYFARIVLPALASGLGETGKLFAEAGQQTVVTPQGGVITSSPTTPAARNIAGTFVGGIGQTSSQVLTQEAAQIPIKQVLVARGQTIGIQFIGPVLASDDIALAKGAPQAPSAATSGSEPAQSPEAIAVRPTAPAAPPGAP